MLFRFEPTLFENFFPSTEPTDRTIPALFDHLTVVDRAYQTPRLNVVEHKDHIQLVAEIPGVSKEDVKLQLHDGVLTISGERKAPEQAKDSELLRQEIRYGSFSRTVQLPEAVDTEKVSAEYRNGLLFITVPKLEAAQPKEITIR
ncbi:MAG TPA: Hsp20/alpha crystallin family protein [Bacteroidota bacterium]|nr:Hsp20/alpha crystallin family protein [Bacteroidota bacterium]